MILLISMADPDALDSETIERCYAAAKAEQWALSKTAFAALLSASVRRAFEGRTPSRRQVETYLSGLHLEDMALACACAEGLETAWDYFVLTYRPVLYRAADATGNSARAREVADSLYGELFGLKIRDGERRSHFRYFHGRSSLATWLRAVLAQRYVDAMRGTSRLQPLPDDESPRAFAQSPSRHNAVATRYIELLRRVMTAVVATLPPRDRLRLRCYYAQDLTLAQIGQLLREHEATVSRNLARTRRDIRKHVERTLRDAERMTAEEIDECFAAVVEDSGSLQLAELLGTPAEPHSANDDRKEIVQDRSQ